MALTQFDDRCVIICDQCFREITFITRVSCLCGLDICPNCFFTGIDHPNHDPADLYFAIEPLTFKIMDGWSALEELLFVDCLSALGIGNWLDIQNSIKSKSIEEIEEHFYRMYNLTNNTDFEDKNLNIKKSIPQSPILNNCLPLRKEFEIDINSEFEYYLKDVDSDEKYCDLFLDIYKDLLDFRKMRRFIIFEKNLIELAAEYKKFNNQNVNIENEIKENKIKIQRFDKESLGLLFLANFISKSDFNKFYKGIIIEKMLKNQLLNWKLETDIIRLETLRKSMLSKNEVYLCNSLKITYSSYLKLKGFAIYENLKHGHFKLKSFRRIAKIDERVKILYKFFEYNKWITRKVI